MQKSHQMLSAFLAGSRKIVQISLLSADVAIDLILRKSLDMLLFVATATYQK